MLVRFDQNRTGAGVSFPGIDPRNWFVLAIVKAIKIDEHGAKADVSIFPDEHEDTVAIGGMVGKGHGLYVPVSVDQLVIVAYPHGNADHGGVIVGSQWDRGQPPIATAIANPADTALVSQDGAKLRLLAPGTGGLAVVAGEGVELGDEGALVGVARLGDSVEVTMPVGSILVPNLVPPFTPPMIPNPIPWPVSGVITGASTKVRAT